MVSYYYNTFLGKRGCTTQNLHRVFGGREVRGSEKSGSPGNSRLETEWFSEEWSGDREMEHEARHKERGAHSAQTQSQHFPRVILRIRNLIEHFHWKTKRKTQYTQTYSSIKTLFSFLYVCVFKQRVSGNFFVMIHSRPLATWHTFSSAINWEWIPHWTKKMDNDATIIWLRPIFVSLRDVILAQARQAPTELPESLKNGGGWVRLTW